MIRIFRYGEPHVFESDELNEFSTKENARHRLEQIVQEGVAQLTAIKGQAFVEKRMAAFWAGWTVEESA